ncbi:carotenoid ester lipase precursor [Peniophora sp. CONT]|nr:carotenoid ester lipase precursor [Peniophora sp. CONT]
MAFIRTCLLFLTLVQSSFSIGAVYESRRELPKGPAVVLDSGIFIGASEGAVSTFRSIPYAKAPVGSLRFQLPIASDPYNGTYDATSFGASCIQQLYHDTDTTGLNPTAAEALQEVINGANLPGLIDDEDCLTINVFTPSNATEESKLPVLYYIYGGGFQAGTTAAYNGSSIVNRALQLNEPVVYVSVNYRLSALGFAGSSEVREAGIGNLGLHDQRLGLRWVQQYVSAFGGDPSQVIIWGDSAGSISVAMQMLANNGSSEGLFGGAFMQSGGPISTGNVEDGQPFFDKFAADAGCGGSLRSIAVFDCLRNVSAANIRSAVQASRNIFDYSSLSLAWKPRVDGMFLTDTPQRLVLNGSMVDVPFVIGDDDDEGTSFSLSNSNITMEDEVRHYLQLYYFPTANASLLDKILASYPEDPTLGSPFDTGLNNTLTPEYKRIAAILGDIVFQAPRRFLLAARSGEASAFSFLYKREKATPIFGSAHGSDSQNIYGPGDLTDALIYFATNLDPNGPTLPNWPAYTAESPALFTLTDGNVTQTITNDTYRARGMQAIIAASLADPY